MKSLTTWAILIAFQFTVSAQAATFYFHTDHLGTPQALTDENQAVVWQGDYDPFGEATEVVSTVEQNLRFPGQYLDRESGLHYNYFRTYDPSTGRYTQSDPIGLDGGINTYGYAYQNPENKSDPLGLTPATGCLVGVWAGPFGCGVGTLVFGIGSTLLIANMSGDATDSANENTDAQSCPVENDDDRCSELLEEIERFKNGIARRIRQLNENAGEIDQTTHIQQLKERQHGLRRRLNEAATLGCKIPSDAWYWASY